MHKQNKTKKNCALIGENNDLSGKIEIRARGGRIEIGAGNTLAGCMILETEDSKINIGDNVFINSGTIIDCAKSIRIEDDVIISYDCILTDTNSHSVHAEKRKMDMQMWKSGNYDWRDIAMKPIHIKKGAWIGARACILKGVTIGEGAVVGMASVVTRDVEPFTLVAGNPARVIRKLQRSDAGL